MKIPDYIDSKIKSWKISDNVCQFPPFWYDKNCKDCHGYKDCISYLKEEYNDKITDKICDLLRRKKNTEGENKTDIDTDIDETEESPELKEEIIVKKKRGRPKKSKIE